MSVETVARRATTLARPTMTARSTRRTRRTRTLVAAGCPAIVGPRAFTLADLTTRTTTATRDRVRAKRTKRPVRTSTRSTVRTPSTRRVVRRGTGGTKAHLLARLRALPIIFVIFTRRITCIIITIRSSHLRYMWMARRGIRGMMRPRKEIA